MKKIPDMIVASTPWAAATRTKVALEETGSQEWIRWGHRDTLPTDIRQKIELVPLAGQVIARAAQMLFGNGLVYFMEADLAQGAQVERAYIQEVEDFLNKNFIEAAWLMPQCLDFVQGVNTFGEMEFNTDSTKVVGLYHKGAEFCRISAQHEKTYRSYSLFYSSDFALGRVPMDERKATLPLLQWDLDNDDAKSRVRRQRLAYHSFLDTPGTLFYGRPSWLGLVRDGGWLDVAAEVPMLVNAMQCNYARMSYMINIPLSYFQLRDSGWANLTPEQQQQAFDKKVDAINAQLIDPKNRYAVIASMYHEDEMTGAKRGALEITSIASNMVEDGWVPTAGQANAEIAHAFGVDPNQLGISPEGGSIGAGSGSGQREAFNIAISTNNAQQQCILRVLNWISGYNGWGVRFAIDHTTHTTSNLMESGLVPSANTTVVQ